MPRVSASATVEVIKPNTPKTIGNFRVEQSDTIAAQEGIRRFVEEMENLDISKG
mgnify:CR=1 FL=1